jgi:hypothetical protein
MVPFAGHQALQLDWRDYYEDYDRIGRRDDACWHKHSGNGKE